MCVVEGEHVAARDAPLADAGLRLALHHALEQLDAARQRRLEAALLVAGDAEDEGALLLEPGVRALRGADRGIDHALDERLAQPDRVAEVDGAAQHAAQHVAAALVAGQHAVVDQEGRGACMLRDGAQRAGLLGRAVRVVGDPRGRLGAREDRAQLVRLVDGAHALQHPGEPLQPGARVDVLRGQRRQRAVGRAVEGHEDEVPDLEEVGRFEVDLPVRQARLGVRVVAEVVVQLGAGAARSGLAGVPVVPQLRAVAKDALGRDALGAPEVERLVVVGVDGHPEPLELEAQLAGEEAERGLDRLGLEVVAEREVAEHLEEREVRVVADGLDVGGAEALLDGGQAPRGRRFEPEEVGLELHHPGRGEQQRGIAVRDERGRGDATVGARLEVGEERGAQLFDDHAVVTADRSMPRPCGAVSAPTIGPRR